MFKNGLSPIKFDCLVGGVGVGVRTRGRGVLQGIHGEGVPPVL